MKELSLVSWNVRGACSSISKRMIKDTVLEFKVNFLCLQETKNISWNSYSISQLWNSSCLQWEEIPSNGLAGGLLNVWDSSLFRLLEVVKFPNWMRCKMLGVLDGVIFHVINVYSPQ